MKEVAKYILLPVTLPLLAVSVALVVVFVVLTCVATVVYDGLDKCLP